jgi:hypothetical protein
LLRRKSLLSAALLGLVTLTAACGTGKPAATVAPTRVQTLAPAAIGTLPPTWTPLPTVTPFPSFTPGPTDTPVPTLSADQICKEFGVAAAPKSGAELEYDARVTFGWVGVPDSATLILNITLHGSKAGVRLDVSAPGDNIVPISLLRLPDEAGQYDWKMVLQHPVYGEICPYSGSFIRKPLVMM